MLHRELVEADGYRRRRLTRALVSGAEPGEDLRRGAVALGGFALAVLLVAGVAVRALIWPGSPTWDGAAGLVIVDETGERYLVAERGGRLQPIANLASAQLVLGAALTPKIVPGAALAGHPRGPEVGIAGAPQRLPTRSGLVDSGWSACTADGAGISYALAREPAVVSATGRGALVSADGQRWVVAMDAEERAWRYRVPAGRRRDALLVAAGLPPATQAVRVSERWLALFASGGMLAPETWVRARWPAPTVAPLSAPLCAELVAHPGADPSVRLATLSADATWTAPPPDTVTASVEPGSGALVSSGGRHWIVDDRALADPIDDQGLSALGFDAGEAATVPREWLALLGTGPALSRELALRPPEQPSG